jgi:hypothetical protein
VSLLALESLVVVSLESVCPVVAIVVCVCESPLVCVLLFESESVVTTWVSSLAAVASTQLLPLN